MIKYYHFLECGLIVILSAALVWMAVVVGWEVFKTEWGKHQVKITAYEQ